MDELVFGPSRAAYDLSGWSPLPLERRSPDEDYTASDYHFHYADVPGHPGVRASTNRVTLTLDDGVGRDVVVQIAEAERAEIVGRIPSVGLYQLRLPTTSFEEGLALATRLRAMPGVRYSEHTAAGYFDAE